MPRSRCRLVALPALVLTVSSCFGAGSGPATNPSDLDPPPTGPCSETDVGTDPPATIRIVASTTLDVPFQSWECLGLNADNFSPPADARLIYDGDTFDVVFASKGELTITASSLEGLDERLELDWQEQSPGQVKVALPSRGETWHIRIALATPDGRRAGYVFMLEPKS